MTGISSDRQLRWELQSQGYSLLRATDMRVSEELQQAWLSLSIDYADLPADEFLPNGGKYRFRRYGRFRFLPDCGDLLRLPHEDYFQSVDINRVTGGIVRKFAPLRDSTFINSFLHELIRFDFRQFPLTVASLKSQWEVQVHLIRVTANATSQGHPTPEGIHRDGAEFVTVHLAELVNADGGEVSIYDGDKDLLSNFRLEQIMDSYLFDDASLWHQASPIKPKNVTHQAIRSILTFDFHHLPD